ncbi:MAG: GntR family transcriptional regulator [Thermodesulfobacteriota bacterium]
MPILNPHAPVPLYHQLADIILARIRSGVYPAGSRIPSEHTLARDYAVGRPTVRQATELLIHKGFLTRRRGSGTYVREKSKEVDLFSFAGTLTAFRDKGISVEMQILRATRLKKISPQPDNPFSGKKAFFLSRLSRVDGMPVLLEELYLHPEIFEGIDRFDMRGLSLSQTVNEQYYLRPVGGRQTFLIDRVSGNKARDLAVAADTPVLLVRRYLHFAVAEDAVYSEIYCRTDRFVFSQTIGGPGDV